MEKQEEMTDIEIERLDEVFEATHEFLERLVPGAGNVKGRDEWDMDLIDNVLETVWDGIKDKGLVTENEFYPFREIGPDEGQDFQEGK